MRVAKLVRLAAAPLLVTVIVGCGSSKATVPAVPKVNASNAASPTSRPAANTTTGKASASQSSGSADCAALKQAVGGLIVNWQLVAQFPNEPDVSKWGERVKLIGTLPEFARQLDTIAAQLGGNADAGKAIEYMKGANDIVQKGLAGDATAPQQLTQYLGTDLTATLMKQAPISVAMSAAKCG
jgi:hypothetical protein